MPTNSTYIQHVFGGGWATTFGPTASLALPTAEGILVLPYLWEAENVLFEEDGGPRKIPGTDKLNTSVLESGAAVQGLYDFWRQGTVGSESQHRIVAINGKIYKDDGDASFSSIKSGLSTATVYSFSTFDDFLIIANDATSDVPMSWDGSTFQNLAGSPPNFAFSINHKNSQFAAGVVSVPSLLYFSDNLDPEQWVTGTSGSISIDPSDGDRITGIFSFADELIVFKGPNKGSIHRITGSVFGGGSADIARKTMITGVGSVNQNCIFSLGNDVGFLWSDGSIRSLSTTDAYGDFREGAFSKDIQPWLDDHLNFSVLHKAQAVVDSTGRRVYFALPIDGSSVPNVLLVMDARFNPVRWSKITAYDGGAIATVLDTKRAKIFLGGSDGFVRKTEYPTRSIDGSTAISMLVTTPKLNYGLPQYMKALTGCSLGISPRGSDAITFNWIRDNEVQQSTTISQATGAQLAPTSQTAFVLGTSTLGGEDFLDKFKEIEDGGEFRGIKYSITDNTINNDVEIHSFGAFIEKNSLSMEN